jgi:hypothetical protein
LGGRILAIGEVAISPSSTSHEKNRASDAYLVAAVAGLFRSN